MSSDSTPGHIVSVSCPHCKDVLFIMFSGGGRQVPCPHCGKSVSVEMVHDGKKWTTRVSVAGSR